MVPVMPKRSLSEDICGMVSGDLQALDGALNEWLYLMRSDWGKEDAPWWYNERASLSQLAGAIWRQAGGWVFEEYAVNRKSPAGRRAGRTRGRCDLMFELDELRVVAEAKQIWLPWTNRQSARGQIEMALRAAWDQVWTAPDVSARYRRFGLVFVTPWVGREAYGSRDFLPARLSALVDEVKMAFPRATIAWAFPGSKRRLRSKRHRGRYFPGVMMVLAPYSSPSA
jgi:hypothetical protein